MHDGHDEDDWGITDGWWDTSGAWHATPDATRAALHRALGERDHEELGSSTWFVRPGETHQLWSPGDLRLEDGTVLAGIDQVPPDLPLGAHELWSDGPHLTRLFVVPHTTRALRRGWGWAVQVATSRSTRSWGVGDLADLRLLAESSRNAGAMMLAHSPLGDTVPVLPQQPSPYFASSRRFHSPLYLRVEDVVGAVHAGEAVAAAAAAGRELNLGARIDRDRVWDLKLDALEAIWSASSAPRSVVAAAPDDPLLVEHATFSALAETHGGGRGSFPDDCAGPGSPGVAAFAARHGDRINFWTWVQLELDRQLAAAATAIPLVADLPVGFDPDGADAWSDHQLLATDCRIGAPPDAFNQLGQDWGLPPYVPWRLRDAGYRPWLETLRRNLRHADALRIDHVMGLFRLYCIPPECSPAQGAYVRQFGTELLDLACMEAERAGAALIGEDLGTVEPEVRAALGERGVSGYRVAWFEEHPPESWPERSVAMLTTHDLPTVAGVVTGADETDRIAAGLAPDPDDLELLRVRLAELIRHPLPEPAGADAGTLTRVVVDAYDRLGHAGSDLVLASLEDAMLTEHRPNLPGTTTEHPNWSVALPRPVDAAGNASVEQVTRTVNGARRD